MGSENITRPPAAFRLGLLAGSLGRLHVCGSEGVVKVGSEFPVTLVEEVGIAGKGDVARALHHPCGGGVRCHAGDRDTPGGDVDEEEDVECRDA